jgi:hypothetical protein
MIKNAIFISFIFNSYICNKYSEAFLSGYWLQLLQYSITAKPFSVMLFAAIRSYAQFAAMNINPFIVSITMRENCQYFMTVSVCSDTVGVVLFVGNSMHCLSISEQTCQLKLTLRIFCS